MSQLDKRLDEILVDSVGMDFCENEECSHYQQYLTTKQAIKQLMIDEFEKMIGEDVVTDYQMSYRQGKNGLRQKLKELFDKEK